MSNTRYVVAVGLFIVPLAILPPRLAGQDTLGPPTAILVDGPREGDRAPDFSLPWASRDSVGGPQWFSLSGQRGRVVVLAFFPKAFTPGCTAEMKTFTEQYADLFGDDVSVVGISADSLGIQQRFAASVGLPFRLLSDLDQGVSRKYGSADRNGYNRRTVYVINPAGRVSYVDLRFGALDPKAYKRLKQAIAAARRGA
ncbi:MAG TPA: peroxiredoxin [Gemmatimonadales bacterium]|nr:peroxiredoxin [Gemmatimonadales bacterium]